MKKMQKKNSQNPGSIVVPGLKVLDWMRVFHQKSTSKISDLHHGKLNFSAQEPCRSKISFANEN